MTLYKKQKVTVLNTAPEHLQKAHIDVKSSQQLSGKPPVTDNLLKDVTTIQSGIFKYTTKLVCYVVYND